jgi:hypothetical protein
MPFAIMGFSSFSPASHLTVMLSGALVLNLVYREKKR